MKKIVPAAFALSLIVSAAAQAQTTAPATPGTGSSSSTGTPMTPMGTTGTTSGVGTSGTGVSTSPAPAAVTTTAEPSRTTEAPVAGANSFTEGQARSRIEERGFAQIRDLKKDDQGIWRGMAMKDGKSVAVTLDYQGNIVGQ